VTQLIMQRTKQKKD